MNLKIAMMSWLLMMGLFVGCNDDASNETRTDPTIVSDNGGSGDGDGDGSSPGDVSGAFGATTFRYGINGGHRNPQWGDDLQAELEAQAGCNSQRISLPQRHLETWGYDIEVRDMQAYAALGMTSQVAFLTAPIRAHSTAPEDVADWELVYYMPSNLYEAVTLENGEINPDNHWAYYVYKTVSMYRDWIKVWEIWNEPDFTHKWEDTLTWTETAPTAAQLPRFNGSVFAYIRMLRVSKEAAALADPEALIATGGIGYASFLDAILRYTDNPEDGSVTSAYPHTGGAYFDVLSFHHYPIYTSGNSNAAVDGYLSHLAELSQVLERAQKEVVGIETTESGAPRIAVGDYPGGAAYARNYLMKLMVKAQVAGVHGVDWFVLSDGASVGESQDPYHYMGLFEDTVNLDTIAEAVLTDTGVALLTLSRLLAGAQVDLSAIDDLKVDSQRVDGGAFVTREGENAYVLWARVDDDDDDNDADTVMVDLPAGQKFHVYSWDHGLTGDFETLENGGDGVVLTVAPQIIVAVDN